MDRLVYVLIPIIGLCVISLNVFVSDVSDPTISHFVSFYSMLFGISSSIFAISYIILPKERQNFPTVSQLLTVTITAYILLFIVTNVLTTVIKDVHYAIVPLATVKISKCRIFYVLPFFGHKIYIPLKVLIAIMIQFVVAFTESSIFHVILPKIFFYYAPKGLNYPTAIIFPNLIFASLHYRSWNAVMAVNLWDVLFPCFIAGMVLTAVYLYFSEKGVPAGSGVIFAHMMYNLSVILHNVIVV